MATRTSLAWLAIGCFSIAGGGAFWLWHDQSVEEARQVEVQKQRQEAAEQERARIRDVRLNELAGKARRVLNATPLFDLWPLDADLWPVKQITVADELKCSRKELCAELEAGLAAVQSATGWLIERRGHAQPDALAGATPYLKLLGDVVGGWMLGKAALAASARIAAGDPDPGYWRTKIGLARVFAEQVLSQAPGLTSAVTQGSVDLFRATPEALGA